MLAQVNGEFDCIANELLKVHAFRRLTTIPPVSFPRSSLIPYCPREVVFVEEKNIEKRRHRFPRSAMQEKNDRGIRPPPYRDPLIQATDANKLRYFKRPPGGSNSILNPCKPRGPSDDRLSAGKLVHRSLHANPIRDFLQSLLLHSV